MSNCSFTSASDILEDSQDIWRTCHATGNLMKNLARQKQALSPNAYIAHFTGHEEIPSLLFLALLCKRLQIKQLSDRTAPTGQEYFVKEKLPLGC